jgi:hypothetical protein
MDDVTAVKNNIGRIYNRKRVETIALCHEYAAEALKIFQSTQTADVWWNNQTFTAMNTVFSGVISEKDVTGWFLAHAVEYGIYLELANSRKHGALRPIVMKMYPEFDKALRKIWGDNIVSSVRIK